MQDMSSRRQGLLEAILRLATTPSPPIHSDMYLPLVSIFSPLCQLNILMEPSKNLNVHIPHIVHKRQ